MLWLLLACGQADPVVAPEPVSAPAPAPPPSEIAGLQFVDAVVGAPAEDAPLIIGLHGRGDRPTSFERTLAGADGPFRASFPQAPLPFRDGFTWWAATPKGDVDALSTAVLQAASQVAAYIEAASPSGDAVVYGFSQGGYLSFALATHHPDQIRKAIAIGGGLPKPAWPDVLPQDPPELVVLHGDADPVVPMEGATAAAAHLSGMGWPVEVEIYPGVAHRMPEPVRDRLHQELADAL
jgi:phospholipase/carboxylesterase